MRNLAALPPWPFIAGMRGAPNHCPPNECFHPPGWGQSIWLGSWRAVHPLPYVEVFVDLEFVQHTITTPNHPWYG